MRHFVIICQFYHIFFSLSFLSIYVEAVGEEDSAREADTIATLTCAKRAVIDRPFEQTMYEKAYISS